MNPSEIYKRFTDGDPIDDTSLIIGILFYRDLNDKLVQCGPVFKLASNEVNRVYWGLRDYAINRGLKLPENH